MKKQLHLLLTTIALFSCMFGKSQVLNTSVPFSICMGGSTGSFVAMVTATQSGATSYTWTTQAPVGSFTVTQAPVATGTSATISFTNCGTYTITCYAYNGGSVVGSPLVKMINVSCSAPPTIGVPSGSTICAGSAYNMVATGAITYTVLPGGFTSSNFTLFPNASTCYTVVGWNSAFCSNWASTCVSVTPNPTVMIIPSNTIICNGNSAFLTATGANSYTWGNGANTSAISVSPSSNGVYSVIGGSNNCTTTATQLILVNPSPTVNVAANTTSVCAGDAVNLFATGANSYTWSIGSTGSVISVAPLSNTCFSVIGSNSFNCITMASSCITVAPLPALILPGTSSVCLGSSILITASGANSYLWNTGAVTASISVTPSTSTCYSVTANSVNGCTTAAMQCVMVNNTCSDVWPGDANSDGIVNSSDVLELGLAFSNTGSPRAGASNVYVGQYSNNWTGTISTGKNKCHADCNGDGTVDNNDTLAIFNNYSLTHAFKTNSELSVGDINLVTSSTFVGGGQWNKADIVLGSTASPVSQLYGVAFDINFDKSLIVQDSVFIRYTPSFFNAGAPNVNFRKTVFNSDIIHAASVRTNGTNVNGDGKIGELWFKLKTGLSENTQLNLSVSNTKKINASGTIATITGGSSMLSVINSVTGLSEVNTLSNTINLYPNPASKRLTFQSIAQQPVSYVLTDITGREILKGTFLGSKNIDLSEIAAGTYVVRFGSGTETVYKKLVIEN